MFNFTNKQRDTSINSNEEVAGILEKYEAAIKKIERLESELNQKTYELNQSCKAQLILSQSFKKSTTTLYSVQERLQTIAEHMDHSNNYIFKLQLENEGLKISCEEWLKRAIRLEFNVLTTKDELAKVKIERDSTVKMIEYLQVEFILMNKGK
jgi:uncharacterized protein YoxC